MDKLKIFISGTQDDMKPEREAVDRAVAKTPLSSEGIRAETTVSQPKPPREWIEEQIRECNLYIGVYSHRYGWVIPEEKISATEFEFNLARKLGKQILVWIRKLRDEEKGKPNFERQKQFLSRVSDFSTGHLRQEFDNPADLEKWVTSALGETFTKIIDDATKPKPSASRFLVPFPHNPDFVGRDEDLKQLHTMLQQGNSPVGIRPTVLVGLGGIGKTQLAVEYAHAHRADYPNGIFWLNAINPLLGEFAKLAEQLELADAEMPSDTAAQKFYNYLNQHMNALVIFDNVEEPRNLNIPFAAGLVPANLQCRTLFTTRKRDFPNQFQPFEVRTLPEAAAMRLLLRHPLRRHALEPNDSEYGLARVICITLGYLPLALALASAFLSEYPEISLYDYRVRILDEGAMEVVDATEVHPEDMPTRHETAVRATLQTSWNALKDENARLALRAAGQLREAELIPIPRLGLLTGLSYEAKLGHPVPLTQALKKLYTASLVEELTTDRLRLHPFVHAFATQLSSPTFRSEMANRVATTFGDMANLHNHIVQRGVYPVLEDLSTGLELSFGTRQDNTAYTQLSRLERVLGREAHHLRSWKQNEQPSFFLQQFRNRSLELDYSELRDRADAQLSKWELSYLREQFSVSHESECLERTLEGHTDSVNAVALTTDGRWAVSAANDKTLKVWDLVTGKAMHTLEGHTDSVNTVALTADQRWAVSASNDETLKVWDLMVGKVVHTLKGHTGKVTAVALTADGRRAVSASEDNMLKMWDLATGKSVYTLKTGHKKDVTMVALTADGRWAVSASKFIGGHFDTKFLHERFTIDETLKVWDLAIGKVYTLKLFPHLERVIAVGADERRVGLQPLVIFELLNRHLERAVAVTADGRRVVLKSPGTIKVWDLATDESVHTFAHRGEWDVLALTADGQRIVSALKNRRLEVWDLMAGKVVYTLKGHTGKVTAVALTADGRRAVSASQDNTLKIWDLVKGEFVYTLNGHTDCVNAVVLTADGRRAISASQDNTLKVWDLTLGNKSALLLNGHTDCVNAVALSTDGRWVVSVSEDNRLEVWDLTTGKVKHTLEVARDHPRVAHPWRDLTTGKAKHTLEWHADSVNAVALTADGGRIVLAYWDNTLQVLNLTGNHKSVPLLQEHTDRVNAVALTTDGRQAVSASNDKTLKVWDLMTGKAVHTLKGHTGKVNAVALTANGRRAISASNDKTLKVWDLMTGKAVHTLKGHTGKVNAVALTADGRRAISASNDKTLKVWDLVTSKIEHTLAGHTGKVNAVALTADGRWAISASNDKTLKVWDLIGMKCILMLSCDSSLEWCAVSPDCKTIVVRDEMGTLHLVEWVKFDEAKPGLSV